MYTSGLRVYLLDNYNWIDFIVLSLYLSSYVLRFLVEHRVKEADATYNGTVARARAALYEHNFSLFNSIVNETFNDTRRPTQSYFMKACSYIDSVFKIMYFILWYYEY